MLQPAPLGQRCMRELVRARGERCARGQSAGRAMRPGTDVLRGQALERSLFFYQSERSDLGTGRQKDVDHWDSHQIDPSSARFRTDQKPGRKNPDRWAHPAWSPLINRIWAERATQSWLVDEEHDPIWKLHLWSKNCSGKRIIRRLKKTLTVITPVLWYHMIRIMPMILKFYPDLSEWVNLNK
jgi:hypothetical protein